MNQFTIPGGTVLNDFDLAGGQVLFVESGALALALDDTVFAFVGKGGAVDQNTPRQIEDGFPYTSFAVLQSKISTLPAGWLRGSESTPTLRRLIYKEMRRHLVQAASTAHSAACRTVEQRVARLICQLQDSAGANLLAITHDLMARWLGARRPGVTLAIHRLEGERLIRATRGAVQVLDRSGLERATAGAYRPADHTTSMFSS